MSDAISEVQELTQAVYFTAPGFRKPNIHPSTFKVA